MKIIKQTYLIHAPVEKVWQALVDPKIISNWGGGPAKMNDQTRFKFSLWGGDIHGTNIDVAPCKKLVQEWFSKDMQEATRVTFILQEKSNMTTLHLLHENIPDENYEDLAEGWKLYYLGPLQKLLEQSV